MSDPAFDGASTRCNLQLQTTQEQRKSRRFIVADPESRHVSLLPPGR